MWVTGCSQSTISKVSEQMKKTGGDREPPPHGLKKWIKVGTAYHYILENRLGSLRKCDFVVMVI